MLGIAGSNEDCAIVALREVALDRNGRVVGVIIDEKPADM